MITVVVLGIAALWVSYVITFVKNENQNLFMNKIVLQEEVSHVMDNLDEIILSKSENGLSFCNKKGV